MKKPWDVWNYYPNGHSYGSHYSNTFNGDEIVAPIMGDKCITPLGSA
jgi:hypothetical protein